MGLKPVNRRRRIGIWITGLAAIAAIAAAYLLTRPPPLIWWTSAPIGGSRLHLRVMVPNGWALFASPENPSIANAQPGHRPEWAYWYQLTPVDRTPAFLRWIFPRKPEIADLTIIYGQPKNKDFEWALYRPGIERFESPPHHFSIKYALRREADIWAMVEYRRTDLHAFNATYKQICDSVRIE
jgi:hypothetical protein